VLSRTSLVVGMGSILYLSQVTGASLILNPHILV
jgi:hypothetical protein